MSGLTHFDANGDAVMVDVSVKDVTSRTATAAGSVRVLSGSMMPSRAQVSKLVTA